ncbi:hypothetical protein SFRURICE_008937, partial [Spodoptera frugiperda]
RYYEYRKSLIFYIPYLYTVFKSCWKRGVFCFQSSSDSPTLNYGPPLENRALYPLLFLEHGKNNSFTILKQVSLKNLLTQMGIHVSPTPFLPVGVAKGLPKDYIIFEQNKC